LTAHISTREDLSNPKNYKLTLFGKVCIITGAGSEFGIGRATAYSFATNGAAAIVVSDVDEKVLQLAEILRKTFPDTKFIGKTADASNEESVKLLVALALQEFERLDVFFANAGIIRPALMHSITVEEYEEVMRVNTQSVFLAIKYGSEAMKLTNDKKEVSNGSIIATASVAGLRASAGPLHYSASKAAVINMVQTSCMNLAGTNIRVNAVCPGLIETNMTKPMFDLARSRGTQGKIGQLNPTLRYGFPSEVANMVTFLASDMTSYVNGQAISVCGGLSASLPFVPFQQV